MKLGGYQEFVCKPTDIELVRYDFMGWKDSVGALFVNEFVRQNRQAGNNLFRFYNFDDKTAISICTKLASVLEKDKDFVASFYSADDVSQIYFNEMMSYLHNVLLEYMRVEGRKVKLFEPTLDVLKVFWGVIDKIRKIESVDFDEVAVRDEKKVMEIVVEVGRQLWASK